jgi:hypothetical protein
MERKKKKKTYKNNGKGKGWFGVPNGYRKKNFNYIIITLYVCLFV